MSIPPKHPLPPPSSDLDSREAIDSFVRDFYRQVAQDDVIGPVFAGMNVDWGVHVPKLIDFWCWQLLGERGYDGQPLRAHEPVHDRFPFEPAHYERWLNLFETTMDINFVGPRAEAAKYRAHRMANALQRLMGGVSSPGTDPVQPYFVPSSTRG